MSIFKRILLFIVANALVVGFVFFAPKYPLPSITVFLLLITNLLCYALSKAWTDRDISKIAIKVGDKEVTTSVKLLRYAASALAFISFITTAEGLHEFVFRGDRVWQAYLASFAVQSILLVFNFLFFHFYIRINSLEGFPKFFKKVLTYFIVLLFVVALTISSTFSFVFIANNTYSSMRAKNSDITIEQFLKDETYRLRSVNDAIGENLRTDISDKAKDLQVIISTHVSEANSANNKNIDNVLSNYNITKYNKVAQKFYTDEELQADLVNANHPEEYISVHSTLSIYKDSYDSTFNDIYLSAYKFYDDLENSQNKSDYTTKVALETQIALLNSTIEAIDSDVEGIGNIRTKNYLNYISQYKHKAIAAFNSLKSSIQSLVFVFEAVLPHYQTLEFSTSVSSENSKSVNDILSVVYTNVYEEAKFQEIRSFLSSQQEILLSADSIDETNLENLSKIIEAFNDFSQYMELKERIDEFIDGDLSITYYIQGEVETDMPQTGGKLHVVSEADWIRERKANFTEFISCLKSLPDVDAHIEKYKVPTFVRDYEPEQILHAAYTINRDLLEDISGFEKAINYFKYDFSLMAVFSLAMALFMDIASFLAGGFMFAASFFKDLKEEKADVEKRLK